MQLHHEVKNHGYTLCVQCQVQWWTHYYIHVHVCKEYGCLHFIHVDIFCYSGNVENNFERKIHTDCFLTADFTPSFTHAGVYMHLIYYWKSGREKTLFSSLDYKSHLSWGAMSIVISSNFLDGVKLLLITKEISLVF